MRLQELTGQLILELSRGSAAERIASRNADVVTEANGFVLAVERVERRGDKLVLVAAAPTIEEVFSSLDRIRESMAEHLGKPGDPSGSEPC